MEAERINPGPKNLSFPINVEGGSKMVSSEIT